MISIIHPSRQRAYQAAKTCSKWNSNAKNAANIQYIVSLDANDNTLSEYEELLPTNIKIVVHDNNNAVQAINNAAMFATGDILIVVSDDFDCPFHWDDGLLKLLHGKSDYIVKTSDKCASATVSQPWIITLPIMDRVYYERFNYIYPPHMAHMFVDTWITHVADLLGRKITLPINFPHNHYSLIKSKPDEVSRKADATWAQGEAAYLHGVRTNFGLLEHEIKGMLSCDGGHINWLKSKGISLEVVNG